MAEQEIYSPDVPIPKYRPSGGQPTAYNDSMCQKVIDSMALGRTKTRAAADMGVCRATLYNWKDAHPEFLDALKQAEEACDNWWSQACQDETCGVPGVQIKAGAMMVMRNALKWDTRDKDIADTDSELKGALEMLKVMNREEWDGEHNEKKPDKKKAKKK